MSVPLDINVITHRRNGATVLDRLSFSVAPKSATALLGANGAGKSTLLRILLGITKPDYGTCSFFGLNPQIPAEAIAIKSRIAFVSEHKSLYRNFRVSELLDLSRNLYPDWDAERERQLANLWPLNAKQKAASLSKGQLAKLSLRLAFSRRTDFFLLDEPSDGLDLTAQRQFEEEFCKRRQEGATIFFTSHSTDQVSRLASNILILHQGRCLKSLSVTPDLTAQSLQDLYFQTIAQ
jgi:ABC-type multidrug transport system ATPase subunit